MKILGLLMRLTVILGMFCSPTVVATTEQPAEITADTPLQKIHIATGVWPGFTDYGEQGAYFELIRLIFPPETQYRVSYTAFNRTVKMVETQHADMVLAVGLDVCSLMFLSAQPFDVDQIAVLFKPSRLTYKKVEDLERYQLATQRGYNYALSLGIGAESYEVDDIATGVSLVKTDRVDAFLVEKTELDGAFTSNQLNDMQVVLLAGEPIYIGFANNERGAELKAWWDQQFQKYYESGQLQTLYQRYPDMTLLPF